MIKIETPFSQLQIDVPHHTRSKTEGNISKIQDETKTELTHVAQLVQQGLSSKMSFLSLIEPDIYLLSSSSLS